MPGDLGLATAISFLFLPSLLLPICPGRELSLLVLLLGDEAVRMNRKLTSPLTLSSGRQKGLGAEGSGWAYGIRLIRADFLKRPQATPPMNLMRQAGYGTASSGLEGQGLALGLLGSLN